IQYTISIPQSYILTFYTSYLNNLNVNFSDKVIGGVLQQYQLDLDAKKNVYIQWPSNQRSTQSLNSVTRHRNARCLLQNIALITGVTLLKALRSSFGRITKV